MDTNVTTLIDLVKQNVNNLSHIVEKDLRSVVIKTLIKDCPNFKIKLFGFEDARQIILDDFNSMPIPEEAIECLLCLEECGTTTYEIKLECGHYYCFDCIKKYYRTNKCCPFCSAAI